MNRRVRTLCYACTLLVITGGTVATAQQNNSAKAGRPGVAGDYGAGVTGNTVNPWAGHTIGAHSLRLSNGFWGYEVLVDGKLYIHQETIPGRPGNKGFATAADAMKVAAFSQKKMEGGESPALISEADLKTLNIL